MMEQSESRVESKMPLTKSEVRNLLIGTVEILTQLHPSAEALAATHEHVLLCLKSPHALQILKEMLLREGQTDIVCRLIITHINTYIKQQTSVSNFILKHDRNTLNEQFFDLFMTINKKYRFMLERTYAHLLHAHNSDGIRKATVERIITEYAYLAEGLFADQAVLPTKMLQFNSYMHMLNAIMQGTVESPLLRLIDAGLFNRTGCILCALYQRISEAIKATNEKIFIATVEWCQQFMNLYRTLFLKTDIDRLTLLKEEMLAQQLTKKVVLGALEITWAGPSGRYVFVLPQSNPHSQRINNMKCLALDIASNCARLFVKKKTDKHPKYAHSLEMCRQIIRQIPLVLLKEYEENPETLADPFLYKATLKTLAAIVRISSLYTDSVLHRDTLLLRLCMPLLHFTPLMENAEQYRHLKEDIVNAHCIDNIENSAGKLIESYIDTIDGSLMHLTRNCFGLIHFQLTASISIELSNQLTESVFFRDWPSYSQIQCCCSVLSLLSYLVPERVQIVLTLEQLFLQKRQFFFKESNSATLLLHTLQLYSFYADNFYKLLLAGDSSNQRFHISVLTFCCELISSHKGLNYPGKTAVECEIVVDQAVDCLNNCFNVAASIPALFSSDTTSLVAIFGYLTQQLRSAYNVSIVEAIIDFFQENIRKYLRPSLDLNNIPLVIRRQLSNQVVLLIYQAYGERLPHEELMKVKMLRLLELVFYICTDTHQLYQAGTLFFNFLKINGDQNVWEFISILDVILRRAIAEHLDHTVAMIASNITQDFAIFVQTRQLGKIFGMFLNMIVAKVEPLTFAQKLSELLFRFLRLNRESVHFEQKIYEMIEKSSYLLMGTVFVNYDALTAYMPALVSSIVLQLSTCSSRGVLELTGDDYYGKLLTICCIHLSRNPNPGITQAEIDFIWKNIFYSRQVHFMKNHTQLKILAVQLSNVVQKLPNVNLESFMAICQLNYYIVQTEESSKAQEIQDNESESEEETTEDQFWQFKDINMIENALVNRMQNPLTLLRDICIAYKQSYNEWFKNVVESMPPEINRFLKQIVMLYQDSTSKRKILKVKREV